MSLTRQGKAFRLAIDPAWLVDHSLIAHALEDEGMQWESVGFRFDVANA
jgi:hypothetical protein